jgi:hypothetical protein
MQERRVLTRELAFRYRKADKAGKKRILDEFTQTSGYHRKYAITLLTHEGKQRLLRLGNKTIKAEIRHKSTPGRKYDQAVQKALVCLWERFNYQCSKLLAPFLNSNIDVIAAGGDDPMNREVRRNCGTSAPPLWNASLPGTRKNSKSGEPPEPRQVRR